MKVLKCRLKTILKNDVDYTSFFNCIDRMSILTFKCFHFIRLYLLHILENNEEIPILNNKFFEMAFKTLSKQTCGPKPKGQNEDTFTQLDEFYENFYKEIVNEPKFDSKHLSSMWNYVSTEMVTSYKNNVTLNFQKYLNKFVNSCFPIEENCIQKKQIKIELSKVKQDLLLGTLESDEKYHNWIKDIRTNILNNTDNIEDDLQINYQKYLPAMSKMNNYLEEHEIKMFQPFPLKTDFDNNYIHIDTSALRCIFSENGTHKKDKTDDEVWNSYFNIDFRKFRINGYSFNNSISTDGTSVSILFIENDEKIKSQKSKKAMSEASAQKRRNMKNMSKDEVAKMQKKKITDENERKLKQQKINKERQKKKREQFKILKPEEREQLKLKNKLEKDEFTHIEDLVLVDEELKYLKSQKKKNKLVVCDPGMKAPLTLLGMDSNNEFIRMSYSCGKRLHDTKRLKYSKFRINNYNRMIKKSKKTSKLEEQLKDMSHKTVNFKKFSEFIKIKYKLMDSIEKDSLKAYQKYNQKLRWYSYINKRRHEDKLLNEIADKYGSDATIICGDWDYHGGIKHISVPNVGLLRTLRKKFKVCLINEFKTSKLDCHSLEECKNLEVKRVNADGKEEIKSIHRVLTFKMSNGRIGCINRDFNSVRNMMNIVKYLLVNKVRPKEFTRQKKTDTTQPSTSVERQTE
ncbi:MAG: hypothetical protein PHX62_08585 [Bacilli bacterium]|nr:hypothetical protein [Bacilli bacterium]